MSRFSRGNPTATANRSAPSPTSMTCPVCSITAFETSETFLMLRTAAHRSGAARGPVHTAGVEFDHAFFVRQATESDRIVVRIVLRSLYYADGSVERVAAVLQESESVVEVVDAIVGADNDRPFASAKGIGGARSIVFSFVLRIEIFRIQASNHRCSNCGTQKSTTAYGHEFSLLRKRPEA